MIQIVFARKASTCESKACPQRWRMRKEYNFSKSREKPYASLLKKQITIRLDEELIAYFNTISKGVGIAY